MPVKFSFFFFFFCAIGDKKNVYVCHCNCANHTNGIIALSVSWKLVCDPENVDGQQMHHV